jgi:hypothetical protein
MWTDQNRPGGDHLVANKIRANKGKEGPLYIYMDTKPII